MQWHYDSWQTKEGRGLEPTVLTREVREEIDECCGYWPTNEAPERLTEKQFEQFVWESKRPANRQSKPPRDYVPLYYEGRPKEWAERQVELDRDERANAQYRPGGHDFTRDSLPPLSQVPHPFPSTLPPTLQRHLGANNALTPTPWKHRALYPPPKPCTCILLAIICCFNCRGLVV